MQLIKEGNHFSIFLTITLLLSLALTLAGLSQRSLRVSLKGCTTPRTTSPSPSDVYCAIDPEKCQAY